MTSIAPDTAGPASRAADLDVGVAPEGFVAGLAKMTEALDEMLGAGFSAPNAEAARLLVQALEGQVRRVEAIRVGAVDAIDRAGTHRRDGHRSAKVMVRHHGRLSGSTALRLDQSARALRDLPLFKAAFEAGKVSADYIALIARAWANPRVRDQLIATEGWFVEQALDPRFDHWAFERLVAGWVDRADEDGAEDRHQRQHRNRDAKLVQDFDTSWRLTGGGGSNDGAELDAIFRRFVEEQFLADWTEAKERLGDIDGLAQHLARTPQQRRWDALMEMARRASSTLPGQNGCQVVANLVIDQHTFERYAAAHAGAPLAPDDPLRPGRRCETLDGRPVDPATAVAAALVGHIRRVVVDAKGTAIDMSRKSRFFRDNAALAARITAIICYWPGCWIPVTDCEIDHLIPWGDHGETNQDNAGPGCGCHNRLRNLGYRAERLDDGTVAVYDPDGNRIL